MTGADPWILAQSCRTKRTWDMSKAMVCGSCGSAGLYKIPMIGADHSHIVVGDRLMQAIAVSKYVCTECGRVQEWVVGINDLTRLKGEISRIAGYANDT
jgi:hypothetical protein